MPGPVRPQNLVEIFQRLENERLTPFLSEIDSIIYHGTILDRAKDILRDGRFIRTSERRGRYGAGIYFYDSDPVAGLAAAKDWAANAPGREPSHIPAVVAVRIKSTQIFDMTRRENSAYVNRLTVLLTEFTKRMRPGNEHQVNEQRVGKLIAICAPERGKMHAIRGCYKLPTLRERQQKGLVILDESCIFDFRLMEISS